VSERRLVRRTAVVAGFGAIATTVHAAFDALATPVHPVFDAVAAVIEAVLDAIALVGGQGGACADQQQGAGKRGG